MGRILIVEDEPLIAILAQEWLIELGHTVVGPAHHLHTGLELARSPLDGAIIDVSLGDSSGYPIAKLLADQGVPFAFATGHADAGAHPEFQAAPVLSKPYQFENFRQAVNAMLVGR
jgi:CheY-like chemotaxis protein